MQPSEGDGGEVYLPKLDLQFIEVAPQESSELPSTITNPSDELNDDEFEFPLFSFGSLAVNEEAADSTEQPEARGRSKQTNLVKVSLREASPVIVNQERPDSYYFARCSDLDRENFKTSAIEHDQLIEESVLKPTFYQLKYDSKVLDIASHNEEIDKLRRQELKLKRRKPGKRQRMARKAGIEHVKEREERDKEIRKIIKKKFHKRGGKKNKKKQSPTLPGNAGATPKAKAKVEA